MSVTEFTPAKFAVVVEAAGRRVDRPGKITRAEELRLQLADEIVQGALRPGAPLDETEIAKRFNVSRTPVREALRQLAASGLIEARAHRRAVVARPSLERLNWRGCAPDWRRSECRWPSATGSRRCTRSYGC